MTSSQEMPPCSAISARAAAEDLADIEAADAARAEIAEYGTIPWDEVKAGLGTESAGGSQ